MVSCGSGSDKVVIPPLAPIIKVAELTQVRVDLVEGPALPMAQLLSLSVVDGLNEHEIKSTTAQDTITRYILKGRVEANWSDRRVPFVMLIYWTLSDTAGNEIGTYTQGVRGARWKWEYGDPRIIRAVGSGAAKPISAMITEDDETPLPFLLMGSGILVKPVEGAPGDGNRALTEALKSALIDADVSITEDSRQASVIVAGKVAVQPEANGRDRVIIVWRVTTLNGFEVGQATQENTVPAGRLGGAWGKEARLVAESAVAGLDRILGSGGRTSRKSPAMGLGLPPLLPKLDQIPGRAPPPPG